MLRVAVALFLLATATSTVADVIDCRSIALPPEANVAPAADTATLRFRDSLPFAVTSFGTPAFGLTSTTDFLGLHVAVSVHQPIVASRSGTATCHEESFALPAVTAPTWYAIDWTYDVAFDDGSSDHRTVSATTKTNVDPVTIAIVPASPTAATPVVVTIGSWLPAAGTLIDAPTVTISGNHIAIDIRVTLSGNDLLGRFDTSVNLGRLPPGNYVVTSTTQLYVFDSGFPSGYDQASLQFAVAAGGKHRAARH